jgi:hypothetical protein
MAQQQHDVSRLPVWGQDLVNGKDMEINRLRRDLEDMRRRVAADPEGSDVFADPYGAPPLPLGSGTVISFSATGKPTEGFIAELVGEDLIVRTQTSGRARLGVFPGASNEVTLKVVPW